MPLAPHIHSGRLLLLESKSHSLIALAEAGHGIAVVPSTVQFMSKMIRIMPILHDGKSLGTWCTVSWDERRILPVYALGFVEELDVYSRRTFPGKQFNGVAPPVPQPPDHGDPKVTPPAEASAARPVVRPGRLQNSRTPRVRPRRCWPSGAIRSKRSASPLPWLARRKARRPFVALVLGDDQGSSRTLPRSSAP
jgi:hypothetical protein